MTRFLFFTDSHIAGENPRHRIDDFPQAILAKIAESYSIAEKENCEFVAFGGDWFNFWRIYSYRVISAFMDVVCSSRLTTYMVIGEHDIYGHNIETYPDSTLAFVVKRCGKMEVLWEPTNVGEVRLYGKHEPDKMNKFDLTPKDPSRTNILVCHELITPNDAPFEMIKTDTLGNIGFDLVVSGDLHDGYQTHQVGKTWFVNPGSLARRTTADAHRMPQVAIIDVGAGIDPVVELRRLQCGRLGSEVFGESLSEVARKIDSEESMSNFALDLLQFEAESTDIHDLVQKAGIKSGLAEEVLKYLSEKRTPVISK